MVQLTAQFSDSSCLLAVGCSHQRAWEYFVESIGQPLAFPVERCEPSPKFGICRDGNGRAYMGYGTDPR